MEFELQSVVQGHHIYKCVDLCDRWKLPAMPMEDNLHNHHAVAIIKDSETVGHVPREISRILYFFLKHSGDISCIITGNKVYGNKL